jgi:hypothetical protein
MPRILGAPGTVWGADTRMGDDIRMADKNIPEQQSAPHRPVNHPALTTPCTVTQLRNWLESGVIAVSSGDHWETTVTTTTTSISVA